MYWTSSCGASLALALVLSAVKGVIATTPSSGCGSDPKIVTGVEDTEYTITSNNKTRQYFVKLPENYDSSHPYRLIYTLHALGGNAGQVVAGEGGYYAWYGLPPLINDTIDAIFVAPNGLNNGWANQQGEDVTFLSELMDTLEADLCVDQDLRFSTGFSYGAGMSYSLACSLGKKLRAIAPLSGNPSISGCADGNSDPVAYLGVHGISDQVLPIAGGRQMRDRYLKLNGCTERTAEEPTAGSGTHIKTVYEGCGDHPVTWIAFDGPHTPQPMDSGETMSFAPAETWEFFSQFT